MGCGGSADNGRNEIVNYRRPKISIRVGVSVENPDSIKPKIVFIFGGPGSRKGRIIDDLVAMYGFTLLSIEELVLQQLPKNIENSHTTHKIDTTIAIQKMLREDPTKLTLDWGLRLVENCISAGSPDSHYLVDAMPNLRFLLIEDFFLKDCSEEMQRFEERYPCLFALNLAIPEEKLPENGEPYAARPELCSNDLLGDEVDVSRTEKRRTLYEYSIASFLEYFQSSNRLVTVDTTGGVADLIWQRVSEFFCSLNFSSTKTVNTVVLFCFNRDEMLGLDLARYGLTAIELVACVEDPMAPIEKLLQSLCKIIDNSLASAESFIVYLEGTSLTRSSVNQFQEKAIMFVEVEVGTLDHYIYVVRSSKRKARKSSLFLQSLKAVCSLENEVCLFPNDTTTELCKQVAICMAHEREPAS